MSSELINYYSDYIMNKKLILLASATLCVASVSAQRLTPNNVDDIVKALTLEEKAELIVGGGWCHDSFF